MQRPPAIPSIMTPGRILSELRQKTAGAVMYFKRLRLEVQFILIAAVVVLAQVIAIGLWATRSLENAVIQGAGSIGAKYLETFVAPLVPMEDWQDGRISAEAEARLDELFQGSVLAEHVKAIKIWNRDGTIFYPSALRGDGSAKMFPNLQTALSGKVAVSRDEPHHGSQEEEEHHDEAIEIYAPLLRDADGAVVLVGEFYENPAYLRTALASQWLYSTMIVTVVTIPMLIALYFIARWGSLIIDRQYAAFRTSLEQAIKLSTQNRRLRVQAETLRFEAGKSNEKILDQIGGDLHDGPLQVLTLIRLRLSDVVGMARRSIYRGELIKLDELLSQAVDDLRNISAGLVLPEIENMSLEEAISLAVRRHVDMTGVEVDIDLQLTDVAVHAHLNICAYRFVQESLMNAQRHAQGSVLHVRCHIYRSWVVVGVVNEGVLLAQVEEKQMKRIRLGRLAQKRRIYSFGGRVRSFVRPQGRIVVTFLPIP